MTKITGLFYNHLNSKPIIFIMDILICIDISMHLYYNINKQIVRRN